MKPKILFTLALYFLAAGYSVAQHRKNKSNAINSFKEADFYLSYHTKLVPYLKLAKPGGLLSFGKPLKTGSEKSQEVNLIYKVYTYSFGTIKTVNGACDIVINKPGMACIFKINGKFSKPIEVGDDAKYLENIFPASFKSMKHNTLVISPDEEDAAIYFKIENQKIISMSFLGNEVD